MKKILAIVFLYCLASSNVDARDRYYDEVILSVEDRSYTEPVTRCYRDSFSDYNRPHGYARFSFRHGDFYVEHRNRHRQFRERCHTYYERVERYLVHYEYRGQVYHRYTSYYPRRGRF